MTICKIGNLHIVLQGGWGTGNVDKKFREKISKTSAQNCY